MKNIYILTLILFIISCGDKSREKITERYDNGNKKLLVKYKGEGSDEIVFERIGYSQSGDTIHWENYLNGEKDGKWIWYYENGRIKFENNYKDGELDGKSTNYFETGQIESDVNYRDGEKVGKLTQYDENGKIRY